MQASAIVGNRGIGILANSQKAGTRFATATVKDSLVRGTLFDPVSKQGIGIESNKSALDVENSTVADDDGLLPTVYSAGYGLRQRNSRSETAR